MRNIVPFSILLCILGNFVKVSMQESICPRTLPNAVLEPACLREPTREYCDYICDDGYKRSMVPAVLRGGWHDYHSVKCENGAWVTMFEHSGFRLQDICIPVALDEKCPKTIPNGVLETYCGHATDWLCDFECNGGYNLTTHAHYGFLRHTLIAGGVFKNFMSNPDKLFCENGVWKTGYEHLGLDVSGVCVNINDHDCGGREPTPHAVYSDTSSYAYPNGVSTMTGCTEGYHRRALASSDVPKCESGEWFLHTSKYDPSIIPATLCVPDDLSDGCTGNIQNGHITPEGCKINCRPSCNEGYTVHGYSNMTCEGGKWLTRSKPYTGDNYCFPTDGMPCTEGIPNGELTGSPYDRVDIQRQRAYLNYKCNDGFRPHRGAMSVECVAGEYRTWQERFGVYVSSLCIPLEA